MKQEMLLADVPPQKRYEDSTPRSWQSHSERFGLQPGRWFAVPTGWKIVQWDGSEWIEHAPESLRFQALQHLIPATFKPLLLK